MSLLRHFQTLRFAQNDGPGTLPVHRAPLSALVPALSRRC